MAFLWPVPSSDLVMFNLSTIVVLLTLGLSLWQDVWSDFSRIATINHHLQTANTAYRAKQFKTAAYHYTILVDSLKADDPKITLQCGHAYFYAGRKRVAYQYYARLVTLPNRTVQSIAWQQLGFMSSTQPARSLAYFRNALRANPENEVARYNYEMVKLLHPNADPIKRPQRPEDKRQQKQQSSSNKLDRNKQNNKGGNDPQDGKDKGDGDPQGNSKSDGQGKDQDKKDSQQRNQAKDPNNEDQKRKGQNQQQPQGDGKGKLEAPDQRTPDVMQASKEELAKLKMSQEQAQSLLDAMKNSEVQYLQQKRYPKTGKGRNMEKPNW